METRVGYFARRDPRCVSWTYLVMRTYNVWIHPRMLETRWACYIYFRNNINKNLLLHNISTFNVFKEQFEDVRNLRETSYLASITPRTSMYHAQCGRIVRNNTLLEALVFHYTLSTSKVSYIGQFRWAHPKGELKTIHVLHPESNNEYELTILSPFCTRVLGHYLLQYQSSKCDN